MKSPSSSLQTSAFSVMEEGYRVWFDCFNATVCVSAMTSMNRTKAVSKIKEYLLKRDWPRFQMSLILILTGLFGFLCSFVMLRMGYRTLWLRYGVAATAGYLVFLVLI